jgi:hypothetical protein
MNRGQLTVLLLILTLIGPGFTGFAAATAQSSGRTVTATADCVLATQVDEGSIDVTIDNDAGMPIVVSYVEPFITGQAFSPMWSMDDPGRTRTRRRGWRPSHHLRHLE